MIIGVDMCRYMPLTSIVIKLKDALQTNPFPQKHPQSHHGLLWDEITYFQF